TETERDLAGETTGNERLIEERGRVIRVDEPSLTAIADGDVAVLQIRRTADGTAHADADPIAVDSIEIQRTLRHRLDCCRHREPNVAVHAADLVLGQRAVRIEVALGGNLRPEAGRVEERDLPGGGSPGSDHLPEFLPADAARRDDSYSRNDSAPHPAPRSRP